MRKIADSRTTAEAAFWRAWASHRQQQNPTLAGLERFARDHVIPMVRASLHDKQFPDDRTREAVVLLATVRVIASLDNRAPSLTHRIRVAIQSAAEDQACSTSTRLASSRN